MILQEGTILRLNNIQNSKDLKRCLAAEPHLLTFFLKTENERPQDLQTRVAPPAAEEVYTEKSVLGANLNGLAPLPNPGCCPRTAPAPMTSFSSPQHEAHMEVAPAWKKGDHKPR